MRVPPPSRRTAGAFLAGLALAGGAVAFVGRSSASAAPEVRATCSATVDHNPADGPASTYERAFTVTSAKPFVDDLSTPTRDEVFTASVVGAGVEIRYQKDVSRTDAVVVETTVVLDAGRGMQNGRAVLTGPGGERRTTTYAVTCRR